jgi:hypothetical protein
MDTELRKETPTFVSGGSGPPCRFALVHLASPCGERRRSRWPLRWPSKIAGANPHTNNLLANVEILSCEDNPSEVSASIVVGWPNLAAAECPSISTAARWVAWRCRRRRQFAGCDAPRCAAQNGKQYQALEAVAQPHSYCSPALGFRNSVILDAETATPPSFDCSRSCTNRE